MTPEQLMAIATRSTALRLQRPDLRPGQAHWSALEELHPAIARRLDNGDADCFNNDRRITRFWAVLERERA